MATLRVLVTAGVWVAAMLAGPARAEPLERTVLDAVNRARAQPAAMASELRRYRAAFRGRVVWEAGARIGLLTAEGGAAVDEAIAFLERQRPLPALRPDAILGVAARYWVATQGPAGTFGHRSDASASPGARALAAGGDIYVSETISYGMATAAAVVRQLIVDDGQPRRAHRRLLFAPDARFAGVACGGHARYGSMCVVDMAEAPGGAVPSARLAVLSAPSPRANALSR